ncbi:MAG: dienelactone hydrolase family protein [Thermomicrobiales bacterium]
MNASHTHAGNPVQTFGASIAKAKSVVILIHGRGSNAANIIGLADVLTPETNVANPTIAWIAPQATLNVWYPVPYTEPISSNEPALTSALTRIDELVDEALAAGIPNERIAVGGFSQGACLSLEYAARGSRQLGYAFGFSGGLIGPPKEERLPIGDLNGLPIFIGSGTSDSMIGIDNVVRSVNLLRAAGAKVEFQDYPGVGHTVVNQEVLAVRTALTSWLQ